MLVFTLRFAQMAAPVFIINVGSISMQQIVYSAHLEWNLYQTCYPSHMHYDWKISCWEAENVCTHTWMPYLLFDNFHLWRYYQVAQVAFRVVVAFRAAVEFQAVGVFRAQVPQILVERRWYHCTSSMFADSLLCQFGQEGSHPPASVNHCQVSFDRRLHLFMPRTVNSSLLLFSDFGSQFLNQFLCFLYYGMWKFSIENIGHIQGKAHVRLF